MHPTKEEAERKFNEAVYYRNSAIRNRDDAKTARNKQQTALENQKTIKKNLEKRYDDLDRIIRTFDNSLTTQIRNTNTKAQNANIAYRAALFCSDGSIQNASLADAFRTKTVTGDTDTSNAYQACVSERSSTSQKITDAKNEITRLKKLYDYWDSEYKRYKTQVSDWQSKINYYSRFM